MSFAALALSSVLSSAPRPNPSFGAAVASFLAACLIPVVGLAEDTRQITVMTVEKAREIVGDSPKAVSHLYGSFVSFDALSTLSPEVAEVLIQIDRPLSFNALTELSAETAAVLAKRTKERKSGGLSAKTGVADLRLNGIKRLSAPAAEALSGHPGKVLLHSLERLDSLSLAQKLAREPGELRLGLTELSAEIAAELAKNRGEELLRMPSGGRRQDGAASVLRLDGIEGLTPEAAEALSAHEGVLVLNGLNTLQPAVAASLAKRVGDRKTGRKGTLVLNGLSTISPESARALAAFPGELVLKALAELTPETAAALAQHRGRLHLTGLSKIDGPTRSALQAHAHVLLPSSLPLTQRE